MSKIKLLVIIQKDPLGEGIGGIHSFIKDLIKYVPDDFEIELVGISTNKIDRPVGKWKLIKFEKKEFSFFPILYTRDQNKRARIPLSLRFTLSLYKYKPKINLKGRILQFHRIEPAFVFRNTKNMKILFIHGNVQELYNPYSELTWSKIPWLYFQLEKTVIPKMDKLFVVSEQGLNFYKKYYNHKENKFSFIPTWADRNKFHPSRSKLNKRMELSYLTDKFTISDKDKIILFAGRLEGSKNPLLLVDSFYKLSTIDKNVKLLIIGDGSLRGKVVNRIKEYKLDEKVKLLGIFSQDNLAKLMQISDVLMLTSACEGMPRVVIEALASGLPVVSTNVGEVKRVVKNGYSGFLVLKHNATDIASAVMQVLKNKEKFNPYNCLNSMKDYGADIILNDIYEEHRNLINNSKSTV
jgi:glycosyltransferase involved in cell wall biosynthesis